MAPAEQKRGHQSWCALLLHCHAQPSSARPAAHLVAVYVHIVAQAAQEGHCKQEGQEKIGAQAALLLEGGLAFQGPAKRTRPPFSCFTDEDLRVLLLARHPALFQFALPSGIGGNSGCAIRHAGNGLSGWPQGRF